MNQRGYVELEIVKNDFPFRAILPIGAPWKDAHAALLELAQNVLAFQAQLEEQAKAQKQSQDKQSEPEEGSIISD